jgi:hypothetical protein
MKTPMEELIEAVNKWMLDDVEIINNPSVYNEYMVNYAQHGLSIKMTFLDMCELLLENEKQQAISAWNETYGGNK